MVTKRKRVTVATGLVVGVPLLDGTFALAHVAKFAGNITCVLFARREDKAAQLLDGLGDTLKNAPIAVMEATSDEIEDGVWWIIANVSPGYPVAMLNTNGISYSASYTRSLFEAYYGLRPWDGLYDPKDYEKALLPGVPVPPTVRFKRDFEANAAAAATADADPAAAAAPSEAEGPHAPVTEGPAVIHIEIRYPGEALPSIALLHRRQALERALEAAGAGEVTNAGGGGGIMDIYLETEDVARAMPLVEAALGASELGKSARVETTPLDE